MLHLIQFAIRYFYLGCNTCFVYQVKYFNSFSPILNNVPGECLLMVFCLMFFHCYLASQSVLLGSTRSDMTLNVTCMLMTHTCIYIYIYISVDPDDKLICSFSLKNLEHCIISDIRQWMTQN